MAFAPAVPEAIAGGVTLADLLVALGAMVAWLVCLGLLWGWNYTLGYLLQTIADVLDFRVLHVHIDLGGPLRATDHAVRVALSKGVSASDHAMGLFFHFAGLMLAWMANFAMATAKDTLALARWMTHVHIPSAAKWAAKVSFPVAWLTKLIAQQVAKVVPKIGHVAKYTVTKTIAVVEKIPRALDRRLTKAEKRIVALAAAIAGIAGTIPIPHSYPKPGAIWRGLTRRTARIERRLARLEKLLGATAMAAVMANVLGISARCLRSGNVGRLARLACGAESWLIRFLEFGTIEAFIATDLCDFSDLLITTTEGLRPGLMGFVDVENALVGCHDFDAPRRFALPPVSLSAPVDAVALS